MAIVVLKLLSVERVRDVHCRSVRVYRYHCYHSRRTFRHDPAGSRPAYCWLVPFRKAFHRPAIRF